MARTEPERLQHRIDLVNRRISRTHGQWQRTELYAQLSQLQGQLAYVITHTETEETW